MQVRFRSFLRCRSAICGRVPRSIPDEHAVFIEPIAAACEILDQVAMTKGTRAAVLGDGKLGLLIAQVLHASGAEVHLLGRHRHKLKIADRAGIATEIMRKKLPRSAYPVVVDATGSETAWVQRSRMCEPRGTVVMKSTVHGLVGIRCGAGDRERDYAGRVAMRAIRTRDQIARVGKVRVGRFDRGGIFVGSRAGSVRAGGNEGDFEGAASAAWLNTD